MTQFSLIWSICTMYSLHRRWPRHTGVSAWCTFLNSLSVLVSILLTAQVYAEAWRPLESKLRYKPQAYESSGIHYSAIQVNPSLFRRHSFIWIFYMPWLSIFTVLSPLFLVYFQHRCCISIFLSFYYDNQQAQFNQVCPVRNDDLLALTQTFHTHHLCYNSPFVWFHTISLITMSQMQKYNQDRLEWPNSGG